ncbi:hypothetical protein [Conexibacter woesei]|uniref:hypothetical protein n=1 Tax=Conexibacter woesei TaxID=191495 RepID=UPI00041B3D42|nr:hypothetical protein [Conexibacter woesei]
MSRSLLLAAALLATAATPAAASVPTFDYTLSGPAGTGGWFTGPVTLTWTITGATDLDACVPIETLRDDTTGIQRSCSAHNADGNASATTKSIRIDQTPPAGLTAAPARPPDAPPFYTAPVALTWSGTDTTSGIASCTNTTYNGPDTTTAAPTGTCTDRAGNVSAPLAFGFAYDATAPPLTALTATPAANTTMSVTWATSPDARTAAVTRDPGGVTLPNTTPAGNLTDGPLAPSTTYTYTVTLRDAAGNATTATTSATTPPAVAAESTPRPKPKARTTKLPTLRWRARRGAKYYNVQLFRAGHKVLSSWPTKNHYTLHRSWRYRGKTYTLKVGTYRYYIWPGYGPRAAHRYGRLLTKGSVRR